MTGGGLYNYEGTLTLTECTVSGETASVNGGGVANVNGGTATLTDCTFSGDVASVNGGGLYNLSGTTALYNVGVSGNFAENGGGVSTFSGTTALSDCIVSGNSASSKGGGTDNDSGTTTLLGCIVDDNFAASGGGVDTYHFATTTLSNCTVSGNSATSGGGLDTGNSTTTVYNSAVSDNAAANGGGLYTYDNGTMGLSNCTVSGNSASENGGGLYTTTGGIATLADATIAGNAAGLNGGGLYSTAASAELVTLGNTIVAENTAATEGPDASGTFTSLGTNLIGETNGSLGWLGSVSLTPDLTGTSLHPLNPLLAQLGNYGGPTQTMALLPGSPAIDAGNNLLIPPGVTTDQRRPRANRQHARGHRRLRVEPVHHRRNFGKRSINGHTHGLPGPTGRDGDRQQSDRARGRGPDHIHPADSRGVGEPTWKPGDNQ